MSQPLRPLEQLWDVLKKCAKALEQTDLCLPNYSSEEISQLHGDPRRFRSRVNLPPKLAAEGWGCSRHDSEQQAARAALDELSGNWTPQQS